MCAALYISSFLVYLWARSSAASVVVQSVLDICSFVLFLSSVLSKETGLTFAAIIMFYDVVLRFPSPALSFLHSLVLLSATKPLRKQLSLSLPPARTMSRTTAQLHGETAKKGGAHISICGAIGRNLALWAIALAYMYDAPTSTLLHVKHLTGAWLD